MLVKNRSPVGASPEPVLALLSPERLLDGGFGPLDLKRLRWKQCEIRHLVVTCSTKYIVVVVQSVSY
jgi:hypothetical protein